MELTAVIRKGEKQFVALCPELDVVSQGFSIEESLSNLTEACELYIEEEGLPDGINPGNIFVTSIGISNEKATCPIGI